jgi:ubiquitin-conjugating enzyme E2 O
MDVVSSAQNAPDFRVCEGIPSVHRSLTNIWQFELFDTCVLKDEPSLIGTVLRTYHDFNSHDPIANCLIISHVPVPDGILQSFLVFGVPPKGYVFIRFARQEFGHSLVSERDVHLVSRTFAIGDNVKRQAGDAMIGTVVSISDSYVLEPICSMTQNNSYQQQQQRRPFDFHTGFRNCNETCTSRLPPYVYHPLRHVLLYDVPGDELKGADDYQPGDYCIEQNYLGVVQDNDIDAVLMLDNNTVVMVENAWELELVVPNFDRPLVALPELDESRRPDVIAYHVGGKAFIPTEHLSRGQFVTTNHRNLRNGRWLHGHYDPTCSPQGHVLDVRTRRAHIKWLCPNVYASSTFGDRAPSALRPYDNLSSYNNRRDLRRTKGLSVLDRGQRPPRALENKCSLPISTGQDLEAGDQVRFRDQSGAFVKYQGNGHGQYNRVMKDVTFGFDMNEFIVFFSKQRVRIQWQDGSETEEPSVILKPYLMPEQELCPGDIVTLKEGSSQVAVGHSEACATAFNEMIYFQGDYILRPEKVGVVQSVDARERLVRIRWFVKPSVRLLQQGNVLQRGAYFGPVSDDVEDISLYEIMAHPTLMRKRRDIVILPPQKPRLDALQLMSWYPSHVEGERFGPALLSWIQPPPGIDLYRYMREVAKPLAERDLNDPGSTYGTEHLHTPDWVGEILDLGLDGLLTIRLCGLPNSEQIRVPWERVLTIVDEEGVVEFPPGGWDAFEEEEIEDDQYLSDGSIISAIEETIEYEGGQRIDDNESGDEGWSTDVDDGKSSNIGILPTDHDPMDVDTSVAPTTDEVQQREDVHMKGNSLEKDTDQRQETVPILGPPQPQQTPFSPPAETNSTSPLRTPTICNPQRPSITSDLIGLASSQTTSPPSFLVLDTPPPSDQFTGPKPTLTTASHSPTFLRRLHREHRILSTSLPPYQIYIRTYESRLDLLRTLILGPADTPYESAPFLIDLYLPPNYPAVPPVAHFHSWTSGLGRINPNLYEEGKICLSLLGTWPGRGKGEADTWTEKANLLQVMLSLMGLVLVTKPFYNEAGFEGYEADGAYKVESLMYSEKAYVMARGFVRYALLEPVVGLEDVLAWLYLPKPRHQHQRSAQQADVEAMEVDSDEDTKGKEVVPTSPNNATQIEPSSSFSPPPSSQHHPRPNLLPKLLHRAKALMDRSSACTGDERDELVDGEGNRNAEAFMRPLSQGAVVMLRRHLEVLERALKVEV